MQKEVEKLLQKKMDRKDFLKHVGIGFAAIVGVTTAVKTVASLNSRPVSSSGDDSGSSKTAAAAFGYGGGAYGGGRSRI